MATMRVTFEVNSAELFDTLAAMKGDTGPLGVRLVGVLLTGEASVLEHVGMGFYGVAVSNVEKLPSTPSDGEGK